MSSNQQKQKGRGNREKGVFERDGAWWVRYSEDGKIHRRKIGTYEDAVKARYSIKAALVEGTLAEKFPHLARKKMAPTFNEFADRFLDEYCSAPGKRPSLRYFHDFQMRTLRPCFGEKRLDKITQWDVKGFQKHEAQRKSRNGRVLSPSTVNRELSSLRKLFNYAIECGVIKENPCQGVKMFPEKMKTEYLTPDECQRLIDGADAYFKPVIICAVHTGMRRGEILNLTWDRVDLANRIIRLDEGKTVVDKPEYIAIDDTLARTLSELARNPNRDKWVFGFRYGRSKFKDIRRPWRRALKHSGIAEDRRRAGKPMPTFHITRHTAASLMMMSGEPLEAVQALLRHRDISTTQRYAHSSPEYRKKSIQKLDEMLTVAPKLALVGSSSN